MRNEMQLMPQGLHSRGGGGASSLVPISSVLLLLQDKIKIGYFYKGTGTGLSTL